MIALKRGWLAVFAGVIALFFVAVIVYSVFFKVWCARYERAWGGTWGEKAFSAERGECIRGKSWFDL